MTAELTSEEIVTKLLTTNQILRDKKPLNNFFGENSKETLGEYLATIPLELTPINPDDYKYVFIKQ